MPPRQPARSAPPTQRTTARNTARTTATRTPNPQPIAAPGRGRGRPRRAPNGSTYMRSRPAAAQYKKKPLTFIAKVLTGQTFTKQEALDHYDASKHNDVPLLPHSLGNFLPVSSCVPTTITVPVKSSTFDGVVIVSQFTASNVNSVYMDVLKSGSSYVSSVINPIKNVKLQSAPPETIRPLRQTVIIRNTSATNYVEGLVRTSNTSQSVDWAFDASTPAGDVTGSFISSLVDLTGTHPDSKTYTGNYLSTNGAKFILAPASNVQYNQWYEYLDFDTGTNFSLVLTTGALRCALNTLVMYIPAGNSQQTYDLTVYSQWGCRYPSNQLLGQISTRHNSTPKADLVSAAAASAAPMATLPASSMSASLG